MSRKFSTPVSMEVTALQAAYIMKKLVAMGYSDNPKVAQGDGSNYLATNAFNLDNNVSLIPSTMIHERGRYFIEGNNHELFLALAAKTVGDIPIVGEYMIALQFVAINDFSYQQGEIFRVEGTEAKSGLDVRKGVIGPHYMRGSFRKASSYELIKHFSSKKDSDMSKDLKKIELTRKQLGDLFDMACDKWKRKIKEVVSCQDNLFEDKVPVLEAELRSAYIEADPRQRVEMMTIVPGFMYDPNPFNKVNQSVAKNIEELSKDLFGRGYLQLARDVPDGRNDLGGRSLWVSNELEVVQHKVTYGTVLEFIRKEAVVADDLGN